MFEQALARDPSCAPAVFGLADISTRAGNHAAAIAVYAPSLPPCCMPPPPSFSQDIIDLNIRLQKNVTVTCSDAIYSKMGDISMVMPSYLFTTSSLFALFTLHSPFLSHTFLEVFFFLEFHVYCQEAGNFSDAQRYYAMALECVVAHFFLAPASLPSSTILLPLPSSS
jgi:hypothetical protein